MGHPKQALFLTQILAFIVSPEISLAFSNTPLEKFLVGKNPPSFAILTHMGVPISVLLFMTGCSFISFINLEFHR
jgi:hypothetical protein